MKTVVVLNGRLAPGPRGALNDKSLDVNYPERDACGPVSPYSGNLGRLRSGRGTRIRWPTIGDSLTHSRSPSNGRELISADCRIARSAVYSAS